jgi:hypothetical protein
LRRAIDVVVENDWLVEREIGLFTLSRSLEGLQPVGQGVQSGQLLAGTFILSNRFDPPIPYSFIGNETSLKVQERADGEATEEFGPLLSLCPTNRVQNPRLCVHIGGRCYRCMRLGAHTMSTVTPYAVSGQRPFLPASHGSICFG